MARVSLCFLTNFCKHITMGSIQLQVSHFTCQSCCMLLAALAIVPLEQSCHVHRGFPLIVTFFFFCANTSHDLLSVFYLSICLKKAFVFIPVWGRLLFLDTVPLGRFALKKNTYTHLISLFFPIWNCHIWLTRTNAYLCTQNPIANRKISQHFWKIFLFP